MGFWRACFRARRSMRSVRLVILLMACILIFAYLKGLRFNIHIISGDEDLGLLPSIRVTEGEDSRGLNILVSTDLVGPHFYPAADVTSDLRPQALNKPPAGLTQMDIDQFAKNLHVRVEIVENSVKVPNRMKYWGIPLGKIKVTVSNRGHQVFPNTGWQIIFTHIRNAIPTMKHPQLYNSTGCEAGVSIREWNGMLFLIEPNLEFRPLRSGEDRDIYVLTYCCNVNLADVIPNWYIIFQGFQPRLLASTEGDPSMFVASFATALAWKPDASSDNPYNTPATAESRYKDHGVEDLHKAPKLVIPTPVNVRVDSGKAKINIRDYSILQPHPEFRTAVDELQRQWNLQVQTDAPKSNFIQFVKQEVKVKSEVGNLPTDESYRLSVSVFSKVITITASTGAGAFYAVMSLSSLADKDGNIPETEIRDGPRFSYRGVMIDVARNFHKKETIFRLIDVMARYKLNKLHFHVTDDEGWRLEIPGLEELTEIGSKRCHDFSETQCLLPFLGAAPQPVGSSTGYYTVEDYRDILRYAVARHVEVIPEVDMPGHAHAAIISMRARYYKLLHENPEEASRYLLSDFNDTSRYASVQNVKDGAINPCIPSTYTFIRKVLDTIYTMHKDISPLKIFNFGGDEVPNEAWTNSPMCHKLSKERWEVKETFVSTVADLAHTYNLDVAAWEDGVMAKGEVIGRQKFPQKNVYVYSWGSIGDLVNRPYTMANAGYKVIMTPATHLYFDHPQDSSPVDRGLIWATRFANMKRVFEFIPEDHYKSQGRDLVGKPYTVCTDGKRCALPVELKDRDSIAGIQGTLFGELLRQEWIIEHMLLPRLLPLAERAWHAASWEYEKNETIRKKKRDEDYTNFANSVGYRELQRLEDLGFHHYWMPPPGAMIENKTGTVFTKLEIPGLEVEMSSDGGKYWTRVESGKTKADKDQDLLFRTRKSPQNRYSRWIHLNKVVGD